MRKRSVLVVLTITLLVVLPACAEPEAETVEVTREVPIPQTVEVTREVTKVVQQTVEVVVTATPRPTSRPTATPETPEFGTRPNPHLVGDTASLIKGGELVFEMTVTQVLRGDAAFQKIRAANQFNDSAPAGFEWTVSRINVAYTGEDAGVLEMDEWNFGVVTGGRVLTYADTMGYSPCCLEPPLDFTLYQGGEADGWIALPVRVDDENPLMAVGMGSGGEGGIFFSLTP
jgi:hypothetical protein